MNVIVCLDDKQGMLFHKRRQSRDGNVIKNIEEITEELWINPFSEALFSDSSCSIKSDKDYLEKAGKNEFCFVVADAIYPYISKMEQIIVYKWNRHYPADFKFDVPLGNWILIDKIDFVGTSHENITRETYVKG